MIDKKKNTLNDNEWVFNGQTYEIIIELSNSGTTSVPISLGSVISLSITESIHSIFPSVELVLDTSGNFIENSVRDSSTSLRERVFSSSYNFNADGRDSFFIYLKPVNSSRKYAQGRDDSQYIIAGWYFIYDEDETVHGRGTTKQKTFYLRDAREQQLIETNLQWSTSDVVKSESQYMYNLSQLSNHFRKAKTGLAIKHLLSKTLNDSSSYDKDWDEGHTSVYYSSSTGNNVYDDVEYVLDRHISSPGLDNCILKAERNQNFSLRSIEQYFTYASDVGPYVSDIFAGETGNFSASSDPDVIGAVLPGHGLTEGDLPLFDGLSSFSLLHVANTDSSENLISNVIHSYDNTSKQFNIECNGHHILQVKDKMQQLYADKMPGRRGTQSASIILPINEKKFNNSIVKHTVSTSGSNTERLYSGINKVMKKSLALSPCINFDIEGSTHRTTSVCVNVVAQC